MTNLSIKLASSEAALRWGHGGYDLHALPEGNEAERLRTPISSTWDSATFALESISREKD